jgi:hypothetical protein
MTRQLNRPKTPDDWRERLATFERHHPDDESGKRVSVLTVDAYMAKRRASRRPALLRIGAFLWALLILAALIVILYDQD